MAPACSGDSSGRSEYIPRGGRGSALYAQNLVLSRHTLAARDLDRLTLICIMPSPPSECVGLFCPGENGDSCPVFRHHEIVQIACESSENKVYLESHASTHDRPLRALIQILCVTP
jgi:hypothetical protein